VSGKSAAHAPLTLRSHALMLGYGIVPYRNLGGTDTAKIWYRGTVDL